MSLTNREFQQALKDLDIYFCSLVDSIQGNEMTTDKHYYINKMNELIGLLMRDFEERTNNGR